MEDFGSRITILMTPSYHWVDGFWTSISYCPVARQPDVSHGVGEIQTRIIFA
jgi:hypothetical protein